MHTVPPINKRNQRRLRWLLIIYGVVVFFWLGPEDNHIWPVTLLGVFGAVLMVPQWMLGRVGGQQLSRRDVLLLLSLGGALMGISANLFTVGLMVLKNARHAHIFPDYPGGLLLAMLERAPVWAAAGGLIGLGLGLVLIAQHNGTPDPHLPEGKPTRDDHPNRY